MIFETKFNIGDFIWFMKDNVPTNAIVSGIEIFHVGTKQDKTQYCAKKIVGSASWLDYQHLHEVALFKTKRDLLASLFGENERRSCKGKNCLAINGIGHSDECIAEHDLACSVDCQEVMQGTSAMLDKIKIR